MRWPFYLPLNCNLMILEYSGAAFFSSIHPFHIVDTENGFQVEGLQRPYPGCVDKSPPKETLWKTFPHRLFFGREFSRSWGPGGVAFLNPEHNIQEKANMCLYRITYVILVSLSMVLLYLPIY